MPGFDVERRSEHVEGLALERAAAAGGRSRTGRRQHRWRWRSAVEAVAVAVEAVAAVAAWWWRRRRRVWREVLVILLSLNHRHGGRRHGAPVPRAVECLCSKLVTTPLEPLREASPARVESTGVEATAVSELRGSRCEIRRGEPVHGLRARRHPRPCDSRRGRGRAVGFDGRCSGSAGQKNDSAGGCVLGGSLQRAAP